MIYLILSIISSTSLFVIFKFSDKYKLDNFNIIIINYIIAAAMGFALSDAVLPPKEIIRESWMPLAVIIGIIFIINFHIIALSSQQAGISVTSVASKMSVVIPILFSILYYTESVSTLKITGISIAIISVVCAIYKKPKSGAAKRAFLLPLILFFAMGLVESLVKYAQADYVKDQETPMFTAILFSIAGISGLLFSFFRIKKFIKILNIKTLIWGILLGIGNFGSIYFFIMALNHAGLDSSIVFGINNIGIVSLSVLTGLIIFREKLTTLNWIGILLSVISIFLLTQV